MTSRQIRLLSSVVLFAVTMPVWAVSYVVPDDRALVHKSRAIVVASALESHVVKTESGRVETVTTFSVKEPIKGLFMAQTFEVRVVGGEIDGIEVSVPGAPRFQNGGEYLLLLNHNREHKLRVLDFGLGRFSMATDTTGRRVAVRSEADIAGFTVDGGVHAERARDAKKFLEFVRAEVKGLNGDENYFVERKPLRAVAADAAVGSQSHSTFAAETYVNTAATAPGVRRYDTFPQTYFHSTPNVTGAPGNGLTGTTDSFALWSDDAGSNVVLVDGGLDNAHTLGIDGLDGQQNILYQRDLSDEGAGAYNCATGGVLGIGGTVTSTSPANLHVGPDGVTYRKILEGNVEMNLGLANCNSVVTTDAFRNALAHELGHAMGFRHADLTQTNGSPCVNDCVAPKPTPPTPDNGETALMRSVLQNTMAFALQPWDVRAVRAVYPEDEIPPPNAPASVIATAVDGDSVEVSWVEVGEATHYVVFRSADGTNFTDVSGEVEGVQFIDSSASPDTAYLYAVAAGNDGGLSDQSTPDLATTVVYTDAALVAESSEIRGVHFTDLRTAVNAVRTLAGLGEISFTAPAVGAGVTVRRAHLLDLRNGLTPALTALGGSASFTDTITAQSTGIKRIHIQELRDAME
jgi:hypothetical protein